ncbi:PadR family transcriptional regulator [Dactylosporangium matsuzakiense]|uniref:PadR family transcriptional regulator n=1 Tax=Dactylosporangium matsuzakiense TaxID=53360 RepID=A0A9W6NP04_9ACTN|nr:PadR family transcriptional regulator [Dactylosporangium matsuzakiense]UWZ43648.1 PadR family transcriptional regulator [Dactylosporangium matsuzakiense]GLL04540.1 PadR family transcriptional regulator [Dactylosporangium matsuzakiense]
MLDDELVSGHLQELRRGTVVLACLLILGRPNYGYALLDTLERSGFAVDANTLYPLLRRLEKQGLLTSDWNTEESRPRKFYRTSDRGAALAEALRADWGQLTSAINALTDNATVPKGGES